ncbi:dimethyl sulfoxide reductase anchor subunit family protein [Neobacillus sp. NPDC097160]|uniref:dimethyl sulfoxide reductase anchor subunit family protein n=1 Tax=Neobacillus sp. NPDC097160 TaxID=3364298 RepID=UPI0037FCF90D
MHEWALLIFTVIIPSLVGGFLFLGIFHKKIAGSGHDTYKIMKLPLIVLTSLSLVGLLASFFHLGKPTHAFYAIMGFGRSWMSNEIVLTGAFIGMACITTGLAILQKKTNPVLIIITAIVGLIAVYCMASTYVVTRINGWGNMNSYLLSYGTMFTLGPILSTILIGKQLKSETFKETIQWAFALTILGIGIQAIGTALFSVSSTEIELINGVTAVTKLEGYSGMIAARWILEIVGLGALGFLVKSSMKKIHYSFIYTILAVLVIGEAMSRYVFYVLGA